MHGSFFDGVLALERSNCNGWSREIFPDSCSIGRRNSSPAPSGHRNTPIGRRDFAMALCLCRLGLRAQEVAYLRLEDLNWSACSVHLRDTKTRRARVLPLPPDLANAIKSYIRHGRPLTQAKGLFVRHLAPRGEASGSSLVLRAMRRAFCRSGLSRTRVHLLRHTFATRLHRRGVNIKEIADLLGHQSLETTGCYTRVNLEELRQVVLPWPEGWR